ncbi:hypothetical protein [Mycobacterium asiaticum]|uniref:hypothetical protein n=1 Tax=Mycobacterium asiaticum TaxID=1790 RepID=UPI0007F03B82|nr:hypothetical protein [Mycobacterium asiaticum]OBI96569.1 hypothetical protein A5661_19435 [Mycobacterium asiaticum]
MYADALWTGAEHRAGTTVMAAIDEAAAGLGTRVTDAPAWPVLRRNLALLALGGGDPVAALQHAAATGLGDAVDPAAVLDWRLPICGESVAPQPAPLHWLNPWIRSSSTSLPALLGVLDRFRCRSSPAVFGSAC